MNIEYYNEFLMYQEKGLRPQAKDAIERFIRSFSDFTEKQIWVTKNLPNLELSSNGRLRNELFEEIVYPVLLKGYETKQVYLMLWLVKLEQNLTQNKMLDKKINYASSLEIIRECYDLEPDNLEVRKLYLELEIDFIRYSIHEWPSGILIGNDAASKKECQKMLEDVVFLRSLDNTQKYEPLISDYENKLKEYIERLDCDS